jgi:hypothetical protein
MPTPEEIARLAFSSIDNTEAQKIADEIQRRMTLQNSLTAAASQILTAVCNEARGRGITEEQLTQWAELNEVVSIKVGYMEFRVWLKDGKLGITDPIVEQHPLEAPSQYGTLSDFPDDIVQRFMEAMGATLVKDLTDFLVY